MIDAIICGDCLEVMPQILDKSVDMVLADLPYGMTACKWDTPLPLDDLWLQFKRLCNGAVVLTASQPFTSKLVMSQPDIFKHEWIWLKSTTSNFIRAKLEPLKRHESVLVFSFNGHVYNPQLRQLSQSSIARNKYTYNKTNIGADALFKLDYSKREEIHHNKTTGYPISSITFNNTNSHTKLHNTQKPVALFEYLIRTYTNEGDTVLDPAAGSGTTAVACHKSNRHYICIEKEPEYCAIAEKRIKEML